MTKTNEPAAKHQDGDTGQGLRRAREAKGYSLDDVAETSGLTVAEVEALEQGVDRDPARTARAASAVGLES